MNKQGPIVVVDDDPDDRHILSAVFKELNYPNEIVLCDDGTEAYEYLVQDDVNPFFILSDVNMPRLDGFQLRNEVLGNPGLKLKCIPYLLISTSADQKTILDAYNMSMQGYFVKPESYEELKRTISVIVDFWQICYSPEDPIKESRM